MSARRPLDQVRDAAPAILPSLLLCDFGNLQREMEQLEDANVPALHLDVMDGNFVPNLTYGMPLVEAINRLTNLPLDVHLMIANPQDYLEAFVKAGADIVTIHAEAVADPGPVLDQIHRLGASTGLAINPDTPVSDIEPYLDRCDLVLIMSVNAGFGGQEFNPIALDKLRKIRDLAGPAVCLEVDGGVNASTIADCAEAGAELFVVGSAIFRQPEYGPAVSRLRELAQSV